MVRNLSFTKDIVSLTKPKITLMTVLVAAGGLIHAGQQVLLGPTILSLLGIAALVSGSSSLNMYFEREQDKKMLRTKDRPLPAGRLDAVWAVLVGLICSIMACFLLYATNLLTLILGLMSLVLYVFCYTPLKQKSWFSLIIGSVPGAMPVALGYTSLANSIDSKAIALFFWAFLWQIPHFLAISLFREAEYTNAGFPVLSVRFNTSIAKHVLLATSWLLVASTIGLYATEVISLFNLVLCLGLGAVFLYTCHQCAFSMETHVWAKRAFKASLFYQSILFVLLIIEAII